MNADSNFRNRHLPYSNPLANALVIVVGVIAIAVSFVIGIFALFALVAAIMILAAIIGIRVWWFNRKIQNRMVDGDAVSTTAAPQPEQAVIEGEYRVIQGRKDTDNLD